MSSRIVIPASGKHSATIIWLHGLGDTGQGWKSAMPLFQLPHVKFVLPTAPIRPVTLNWGMPCTAWYDIYSIDDRSKQDEEGLVASVSMINDIIKEEIQNGIPSNRIILGGFSQGGAMSLLTGLRHAQTLGGIVGLSCYLPLSNKLSETLHESNKTTPIMMCHGKQDPVVSFSYGHKSFDRMKNEGLNVKFYEYEGMQHEANDKEISDVRTFLHTHLPHKE